MITQAYILNQTNQLIDINDVYTSFTTLMNVTCENLQDSFDYAIINQNTLDSNQIKFKRATGFWEDTFTINQENFQNWYLVLKSDKDTKCTLNLNITPLNYNPEPPQQPNTDALSQVRPSSKNSTRMRQEPTLPPQPKRQVKMPVRQMKKSSQKPVQRYVDSDSDDEEDAEYFEDDAKPSTSTGGYYKYIMYSLIGIAVLLVVLWWTGYVYKVPYLNKLFPSSMHTVATTTHFNHPPPTVSIPTQPHVNVESPFEIDTNFINEMRELKIDL